MSFLGDLFGSKKKGKSVLGVDVGSSSLKLVQLRKEGGVAVLETYGELSLGPYAGGEAGQATNLDADKMTETLKDLMREANVTTTDCGVSIPFSRSLLTLVDLPRRESAAEQKTVIELEARKYIPVPISEVQLDWFIVPDIPSDDATPRNVVSVLLVAVHNDELQFLQTVVTGAGLAATFYEIEIFSTIRSVVDEPIKPVMVLDIGASATKTYVVERGIVALSHNIPHGGQDVTQAIATSQGLTVANAERVKKESGIAEPEPDQASRSSIELTFSRIFAEAKRVLVQYETAHEKSISAIILTGGGGVTKALGDYAHTFFAIDVRIANPFSKTQAPAFMQSVLGSIGPEFAVAVGVALRKLEEIG